MRQYGGKSACRVWLINRSKRKFNSLKSSDEKKRDVLVHSSVLGTNESYCSDSSQTTSATSADAEIVPISWDDKLCRPVYQKRKSSSHQDKLEMYSDVEDSSTNNVSEREHGYSETELRRPSREIARPSYGKSIKKATVTEETSWDLTDQNNQEKNRNRKNRNRGALTSTQKSDAVQIHPRSPNSLLDITPPSYIHPRQSLCRMLDSLNSSQTKKRPMNRNNVALAKNPIKRLLEHATNPAKVIRKKKKRETDVTLSNTASATRIGDDFKDHLMLQQPSSRTSLSIAKAYFDYLDKTHLPTSDEDASAFSMQRSGTGCISSRTRFTIDYQCPHLKLEYKKYCEAAAECGVDPLGIQEFASQRGKHFNKEGFFDGFFDE